VAFPLYFATQSGGNPVVLEVDSDLLDLTLLHPDEDYISARLKATNQKMAHEKIRQKLWKWQSLWKESLEMMGNCCYKGTIPPLALTRYAKWDHKRLPGLSSLASRQVVNVQGYLLVKPFRLGLIAWLFGDQPTMYIDPEYQPEKESDSSKEQCEQSIKAISAKRDSIEVVPLRV
jgi:hypothetical protein